MEAPAVEQKRNVVQWVAIAISVLALSISFLQWWNSRNLTELQASPSVSFVEANGAGDPIVGIQMVNDGPLVRLKEVSYYVDKKPASNLDDAIEMGNLSEQVKDKIETFEYGDGSSFALGEKQWILSMEAKGTTQKDLDQFSNFFHNHLGIQVEACSLLTSKCETLCSTDGWCK